MDIQPQKYYNILVIGDACVDRYHYGVCERLSPEAPVPILRHIRTEVQAGMGHNVAANLRAFENVKVDKLFNMEELSKERFIDLRSKQQIMRADYGEEDPVEPLKKDTLKYVFKKKDYDAIVISDYNKGFVTESVVASLLKLVTKHGNDIPVFVDTKKPDLNIFKNCIIKINQIESQRIKDLDRFTHFENKLEIITTIGDGGAVWKGKHYPTTKIDPINIDVSGAGDTFMAALVYAYLKCSDMGRAIQFANLCSGIAIQKSGTYALKSEDVRDLCV